MSKSLGNVILVSDIINSINPIVIRLALMSSHYRQPLNWTDDTVNNAKNIYEKIMTSLEADSSDVKEDDNDFLRLLCDDLNTPNAIQYLVKQAKDSKNNKNLLPKLRQNCDLIGLKKTINNISIELKKKVEDLISQRETARLNKDYASADQIRSLLLSMNVDLKDGRAGVTWKIKD